MQSFPLRRSFVLLPPAYDVAVGGTADIALPREMLKVAPTM